MNLDVVETGTAKAVGAAEISKPASKERTYPVKIERGSAVVKIYLTPSHGCESFTLSYYHNGVRKRPTFATYEAAEKKAIQIANALKGKVPDTAQSVLTLTNSE